MRVSAFFVTFALAQLAEGFTPREAVFVRHHCHDKQSPFGSTKSITTTTTSTTTTTTTSRELAGSGIELSIQDIVVLGTLCAVAGTFLRADKIDSEENESSTVTLPAPTPVVPAPSPAPKPEPEPTPVAEAAPEPVPEPAVEEVEVETEPSKPSAGESIAELRREVARHLDDSPSAAPSTQLLKRSSKAEEKEAATDDSKDAINEEKEIRPKTLKKQEKKNGLFRKVFRVVKKVIAPWRKWENIS